MFGLCAVVHYCPGHPFLQSWRSWTQTTVELDQATSASPVCLTCLMAPSMSAVILLVAFFAMASSMLFVGALQMRPKPVLSSFRLYIRPPPQALA